MKSLPEFGDSHDHAWLSEFLDRCFPESGGRVNADLKLAVAMCEAEPKSAQVAMQLLAQAIRADNSDGPGKEFLRFALGVLFTSYVALAESNGRCGANGLPPELEVPVRWNPEILECANALGPIR